MTLQEQEPIDRQSSGTPPNLKPSRPAGQNSTLMMTAAIFFAIGFLIAAIAFSGGNDDGSTDLSSVSRQSNAAAVNSAVRGTMAALNVLDVPEDEAGRINAAVQGTFIALTPTVTPTPTAIPVQQTFDLSGDPTIGDPLEAKVVMVEFASYTCGFCGRFHRETLPELIDHYGDQFAFVVRNFPRSDSEITLNAIAHCAYEQSNEQFWAFTDQFWENQAQDQLPLNDETINFFISNAELDPESLNSCLASESVLNKVLDDREAALIWGVTGTPAFFVNGVPVSGARPLTYFQDLIDDLLRQQGIEPPART